ncbi:universal stress protein [Nocardioides panacisoli]|uniref:universal stress protein n=1 Tax=Nocardioides panacisoli TaxID=627624 RepID=UPI001C63402C|nr:universal stress protein [Nocardioides panacisoli]QYJ05267.1 universal stress protein [Nocardioides panacisoli]
MNTSTIPSGAVVVAFDGSDHAERAAQWAATVADREHRPLVLVHAAEPPHPSWVAFPAVPPGDLAALQDSAREAGTAMLESAAARIREGHPEVEVVTHVEIGDAREVLVALSDGAHLVAIGSRGHGAVRRLLLGSVAAAVTRHAACPVAVLRPHVEASSGGGVLVGIDADEPAGGTLDHAFRAASWVQSPLTILYCFWDPTRGEDGDALIAEDDAAYAEERASVSESMAGLREKYPDVEVHVQLARGLVDRIMVEQARGRDLLVVGARSHGAVAEALLGSVATTMVEYAPCPVVVVPRSDDA